MGEDLGHMFEYKNELESLNEDYQQQLQAYKQKEEMWENELDQRMVEIQSLS